MTTSDRTEHPRLALLIGAPFAGDVAMHNDVVAMYEVLRKRGLAPEEILSLDGKLDRRLLLGLLRAVRQRMASWLGGELFLYVSGHGFFTAATTAQARVGVWLQKATGGSRRQRVYWGELFETLSVPASVTFTLLPDH